MIRSGNVQVFLATAPVDMRKSFDSLAVSLPRTALPVRCLTGKGLPTN